jgi:hypothetical protein
MSIEPPDFSLSAEQLDARDKLSSLPKIAQNMTALVGLFNNAAESNILPNRSDPEMRDNQSCVKTVMRGINAALGIVEERKTISLDYYDRNDVKRVLAGSQEQARTAIREAIIVLENAIKDKYPAEYNAAMQGAFRG